jgi:DNA-binding PadR family transcriptional regulator
MTSHYHSRRASGPFGGGDHLAHHEPFANGWSDRPRRYGPCGPGAGPEGPFGPGPGGRGFRHGRRAGRGDVRDAILLLLAEQPRHGYELIREIQERTNGAWTPSPGAIYPALSLLEDEGLVTIAPEGGRRLANLSEAGRAYVTAHGEELGDPFQDAAARTPKSRWALRDAVRGVMGASMQVAQNGDESQVARALVVLDRARKDLYLLLAGEQPTTPPAPDDTPTA